MDITEEYSELFASLMALIRSSNSLSSLDVDFVRSVNRDFAERSEAASGRLLDMINKLIVKCNSSKSNLEQPFGSAADVQDRWRSIEQTFDLLFDKIDFPRKQQQQSKEKSASPNPGAASDSAEAPVKDYMRLANNIPKPQLHFTTKVDNSLKPFKPLLTQKPFSNQNSLSKSITVHPADEEHSDEWYEQPYKQEILESPYPEYNPENNPTVEFPSWEDTPFTFVDTPKKLFKMVSKLEKATEIAVDVEHHDYRSFLGLVCLVQISALGEDYVVDALALRSELQVLNKVFANPSIIKVFHGAKMDIMWLQRDLGVYVVGLFDTYFASRELQFPKLSLAYLLQTYANFQAQKKYQLADWRLRPLPKELIDYARADTHFLLYIYHKLRERLDEEGRTETVLEASRQVASYRYETPGWNETEPAWVQFAIKYRLHGQLQRAILVRLFQWRDEMARKYDESTRYIMAPQFLANLCITKPGSAHGVLAASHNVSPIVRQNAEKLAELIQYVCANPKSVDTTIPEPKIKTQESSLSPSLCSGLSVAELKLDHSPFVGKSQPITCSQRKPLINLSVLEPKDLERVQAFNEGSLREQQEAEARAAAEAKETAAKEQLAREARLKEQQEREEREKARKASNSSGKRLNIVDDSKEFELSTKVDKPSGHNPARDEPAFDFKSAKGVLRKDDSLPQNSYSQFGSTGAAPKGVHKNSSKFKRAKSVRR